MKKVCFCLFLISLLAIVGCGEDPKATNNNTQNQPQSSVKADVKANAQSVELFVSAAASLTDVMKEIDSEYRKLNPNVKITFNFGSSGALQQAIENGGHTDLFFSAAQKQMDALEKSNNLAAGTRKNLLLNKVVLIVPSADGKAISDFKELAGDSIKKIALGEPKGVPVGQYSQEILTKLGLWEQIQSKFVFGSDVRQVLSWVSTGNVDCGMVYATDAAVTKDVKVVCAAPEGSHKPVIYPAAIIKDTKNLEASKAFLEFVSSEKGMALFKKYGFEPAK